MTEEKRDIPIVVSLTSFPERMYEIKYTLYSLLQQTIKPDYIILWLAEEEFPRREKDIGEDVLAFRKCGVEIRWCKNIKSYKKLIPSVREFPEAIIVTTDDDAYYDDNWLELLYQAHCEFPNDICCHRAHQILFENGNILPYNNWKKCVEGGTRGTDLLPTGVGGILYPPHSLSDELFDSKYEELTPHADDIWFWTMGRLAKRYVYVVKGAKKEVLEVNLKRIFGFYQEKTLSDVNVIGNGNDIQMDNILNHYPYLLEND